MLEVANNLVGRTDTWLEQLWYSSQFTPKVNVDTVPLSHARGVGFIFNYLVTDAGAKGRNDALCDF